MINVKKLIFKYSQSIENALNNINIDFPDKAYIAIVGHNGSGKSTLSKLLVGLYKPISGSITIDGTTITKKTLKQIRSKIGIVFQNPDNQFIGSTVEDDIAFGLENKKLQRKEMEVIIKDLSEKVGMDDFLDKSPENLSGGQKQRVAIASTLALDPKIIIFDEVTSMLDPKGKREVLSLIKDIQKNRDKTLISITHDMDEAIMADKIIVMSHGEVIASGNPREILNNKKIIKLAKIDSPMIYKLSEKLKSLGIKLTFDEDELIEALCD
jgi:energy-coupling factor transport system ATP-binding protein